MATWSLWWNHNVWIANEKLSCLPNSEVIQLRNTGLITSVYNNTATPRAYVDRNGAFSLAPSYKNWKRYNTLSALWRETLYAQMKQIILPYTRQTTDQRNDDTDFCDTSTSPTPQPALWPNQSHSQNNPTVGRTRLLWHFHFTNSAAGSLTKQKPQPKQSNSRQNKFLTLTRLFYEAVNPLHDTLHPASNHCCKQLSCQRCRHVHTFTNLLTLLPFSRASGRLTCHDDRSSRPVTKLCLSHSEAAIVHSTRRVCSQAKPNRNIQSTAHCYLYPRSESKAVS